MDIRAELEYEAAAKAARKADRSIKPKRSKPISAASSNKKRPHNELISYIYGKDDSELDNAPLVKRARDDGSPPRRQRLHEASEQDPFSSSSTRASEDLFTSDSPERAPRNKAKNTIKSKGQGRMKQDAADEDESPSESDSE